MLKPIENISAKLLKAIEVGLFNEIWYFIKDFNNYKLQFILEYNQEDYDLKENIILGELNPEGFKDNKGQYHWLRFNDVIKKENSCKIIPDKYETKFVIKNKENFKQESFGIKTKNVKDGINQDKAIKTWNLKREQYSFDLQPHQFHVEESAFSLILPFEFLFKIEEAISYYLVKNTKLRDFIFELMGFTFQRDPRFDSYLGFYSNISDQNRNVLLNWFFGFDCDELDSIIRPIQFDIIKRAYEVLDVNVKISNEIPFLPKTLLDDLYEIEKIEESGMGKGIVFKEYHRIIERFSNFIYNELFDRIQSACLSISKDDQSSLGVDDMLKKKENYRIMKLYQLSKLLKFLSSRTVNILDKEIKEEVKEKHIPIIDTFSGFSNLRNIQTHDRLQIDENVLNSGIIALKSVIRALYKIVNEASKK